MHCRSRSSAQAHQRVCNLQAGTFLVRTRIKKPPRRFSLRLAEQTNSHEPNELVIYAQVQRISTTLFDNFGGLVRISWAGMLRCDTSLACTLKI